MPGRPPRCLAAQRRVRSITRRTIGLVKMECIAPILSAGHHDMVGRINTSCPHGR